MSVRHIHARPGEYIAVHRGTHKGADNNAMVLLYVIGIVGIGLIVCLFWQVILAGLLVAGAAWLLWKYRASLRRCIRWAARKMRR